MFVGVHAALAIRTNTPELMISDQEGKAFMSAAQNVLRHYSVETTQKTLDWIAFVGVTCSMYAPRALAIYVRTHNRAPVAPSAPGPVAANGKDTAPAFAPVVVAGEPDYEIN